MNSTAQKQERPVTRREAERSNSAQLHPVKMVVRVGTQQFAAEVVNYHYKGACLKFDPVPEQLLEQIDQGVVMMDFYLGQRCARREVSYRLAWESLAQDKMIGIEFLGATGEFMPRQPRYAVHPEFSPQITATDPMDPNRSVFFRVQNISESGMLLVSSLSNKHLLPGLSLKKCQLSIPGQKTIEVSLFVANCRRSDIPGMFELGTSVDGNRDLYAAATRQYISLLAPMEETTRNESEPVVLSKKLKQGITYQIVDTQAEYEKVLKLRYAAYASHGKTKPGATWNDQGEGLANEGVILAGYLGSRLICSVELRFGDSKTAFRIAKYFPDHRVPMEISARTVEINKLAVHPKAQGSDIFLGIFQKMHSILVTRGGYDVLIAATDKLAPLYLRMGFNRTEWKVPHPHLENQSLNILLLPHQRYVDAKQINPVAWVAIYDATQRFLESVGVAKPLSQSWLHRAKRRTGFTIKRWMDKRKGQVADRRPEAEKNGPSTSSFIDPKWTSQHIIAPIMMPYILEAEAMIGVDKVDSILGRIGVPRSFLSRTANWLSVAFLDEFIDQFKQFGDIAELSRRSGSRSLQLDQIGVKYYLLKHFVTPKQTFLSTEKILPTFNRTRSYRLLSISDSGCTIAIGSVPGFPLPKHRESCLNWQANLEACFNIMTGTVGTVQKLACCYDGAPECLYQVSWAQAHRLLPTVIFGVCVTAALFGIAWISSYYVQTVSFAAVVSGALALGAMAAGLREALLRRWDSSSFTLEFARLEQEATEKYSELQAAKTALDERYREARLLEETAKTIQASNELSTILKVSLDAICANFNFDRAFVMLADEKREKLRTSAVAFIKEGVEAIWGFQVDVSNQRTNSIFISSVFHTGNPVLIDSIEPHFFQFNEVSQKLIQRLGTKGFILVPIPSASGQCWGVLIADKTSPDKVLNRTDLTLLQRMAQHLGIALDKQATLDHERNVRLLFQKYVPSQILNQIQPGQSATLGGQSRKIACLFFDIRDFTEISDTLPPQVTLDLLNKVFSVIQDTVATNNGWIDKFLGDGALVTWGTVGEPMDHTRKAVDTAFQILDELEKLNTVFSAQGLPAIRIGIGLNCGPAIVGNIGAQSRMEFTSIGGTINVASRLENITKELNAALVVSEAVLEELDPATRARFAVVRGVSIRGIARPMSVGIYPIVKSKEAK